MFLNFSQVQFMKLLMSFSYLMATAASKVRIMVTSRLSCESSKSISVILFASSSSTKWLFFPSFRVVRKSCSHLRNDIVDSSSFFFSLSILRSSASYTSWFMYGFSNISYRKILWIAARTSAWLKAGYLFELRLVFEQLVQIRLSILLRFAREEHISPLGFGVESSHRNIKFRVYIN